MGTQYGQVTTKNQICPFQGMEIFCCSDHMVNKNKCRMGLGVEFRYQNTEFRPGSRHGNVFLACFSKEGELKWKNQLTSLEGAKLNPSYLSIDSSGNIFIGGKVKTILFAGNDTQPTVHMGNGAFISQFDSTIYRCDTCLTNTMTWMPLPLIKMITSGWFSRPIPEVIF